MQLENVQAQAYNLAMSAADISNHVKKEIRAMVKSNKSPLGMCKQGIARLSKENVITAGDQKKLLEFLVIVFKYVEGKIEASQAELQKQNVYAEMLFNTNHSSTALCIVNAVTFDQPQRTTSLRTRLTPRQNAALGALAGGISGGLIGWGISGGNPLGAGLGAAIGAIAGAIYGACTAD